MAVQATQTTDPLELLDEQGEFPQRWAPEVGDVLVGTIRRYSDVELKLSGLTRLCVIQTDPKTVLTLFLSGAVLRGEFKKLRPRVGERISIRYVGKPAGKDYHRFVVRMLDREEEENPDWDAFSDGRDGGTPYADAALKPRGQAQQQQAPANRGPQAVDVHDPFKDDDF